MASVFFLRSFSKVTFKWDNSLFYLSKKGRISRSNDSLCSLYKITIGILSELLSEWNGFAEYTEKLRVLQKDIVKLSLRSYDFKPNHFNTLIHDDLWSTNLMMKSGNNSGGESFDNLVFIDFQFSFWGSPTLDLHYFLNTSICDSLRPQRLDEFVQFYYEELVKFLRQLNSKRQLPTWIEFYQQYQERMLFGMFLAIFLIFQSSDLWKIDVFQHL